MAENSYRSILKGTSIFGGVQMFQILMSLARGKFVALLLGPAGMGVNALFSSAFQALTQISCLGLNLAIVKETAAVKEENQALRRVVAIARRLVALTGLLGAIVCLLFADPLSRMSFGSESYAWGFRILAIAVFFSVAGNGMLSVLQGLHLVKRLSLASLIGGAVGLFAGVPLYYFFGTDGIPPAIVLMAFSTFLFYWISVGKAVDNDSIRFSWKENMPTIRRLLALGIILIAGDLISTSVTYGVNLFIRQFGTLADVGLFQGANSLTNQYAGVVFTAMMLDYFPRLSAASSDSVQMRTIVCRQIEIVALIATPLMSLLIVSSPLVIRLLLSSEFMEVVPLMRWLGLAILVKAISYPLGWITFAKDNKKIYFWMEAVGANALTLIFDCAGFYFFTLPGLGYALLADCAICLTVYILVNRRLYGLRLDGAAWKSIFLSLGSGTAVFAASFLDTLSPTASYILMGLLTAAIMAVSFMRLKKLFRHTDD